MGRISIETLINHPVLDEWDIVPLFKDFKNNRDSTELNSAFAFCTFVREAFPKQVLEILSLRFFPCYKQYTIFENKRLLCVKFKLSALRIFLKKYLKISLHRDTFIIEQIKKLQFLLVPQPHSIRKHKLKMLESFFKSNEYYYLIFSEEFLKAIQQLENKVSSPKTIKTLNPLLVEELAELGRCGLRF